LGLTLPDRMQETLDALERSHAALTEQAAGIKRHEADLRRHAAQGLRHQAEVDRATAQSVREQSLQLPDARGPIGRSIALRRRLIATARDLAELEAEIALVHDELADRVPERSDEYRSLAKQARLASRRADEISQFID